MKKNVVVVTHRKKEIQYFEQINKANDEFIFSLIVNRDELNYEKILKINPIYIFVIHWPWFVDQSITSNFNVILFHMTDLPYGRGGSPLQNLIINGHKSTKITALRMSEKLDAGDVYFKAPVSLNGNAEEIYNRVSKIIFEEMIPKFLSSKITPHKQVGTPTYFYRRNPKQSEIQLEYLDLNSLYDFIRMLDDDEYPRAYLRLENYTFTFSKAKLNELKITASVVIKREK